MVIYETKWIETHLIQIYEFNLFIIWFHIKYYTWI